MSVLNDSKIYLWLHLSGLSVKKQNTILSVYSMEELWHLYDTPKVQDFVGDKNFIKLKRYHDLDYIDKYIETVRNNNIKILTRANEKFPEYLKQSEVCPPTVLYYRGDLDIINTESIAIVGTRHCTRYGKDVAEIFASALAKAGLTIVSGLATGIDMYAHKAALNVGGKTVAVLGSGLNVVTPVGNHALFDEISAKGLVLSEYPPSFEGTKYSFPERNRIISGLSRGVLVVEAALKSGALITADYALEQGKELYAVCGNITSPQSKGTNKLIKDNARAVTEPEDILEDLKYEFEKAEEKVVQLDLEEQTVYDALKHGNMRFDELIEVLGIKSYELSGLLTNLEIKGIIRKLQSNYYGIE